MFNLHNDEKQNKKNMCAHCVVDFVIVGLNIDGFRLRSNQKIGCTTEEKKMMVAVRTHTHTQCVFSRCVAAHESTWKYNSVRIECNCAIDRQLRKQIKNTLNHRQIEEIKMIEFW